MAQLNDSDVLKLAQLARLQLSEDEVAHFKTEINHILHYVEQLQSVDLDNLDPTYQVTGLTSVTRPDEVINYGSTPEDLLKNAPAKDGNHIKVKRMLT